MRPKRVAAPRGCATKKDCKRVRKQGRGSGLSFSDRGKGLLVQISKTALQASCEVLDSGTGTAPIFNPDMVNFLNYFSEAHLCITKR
jgi:hypothetical protein